MLGGPVAEFVHRCRGLAGALFMDYAISQFDTVLNVLRAMGEGDFETIDPSGVRRNAAIARSRYGRADRYAAAQMPEFFFKGVPMNITEFIDSMNCYMKSVDDRRIEFYQSIPFQPGRSLDGCIFITFTPGKGTTMHMAGEPAKPTTSKTRWS